MKKLVWIPIIYLIIFGVFLVLIWPNFDNTAIIAISSVLAGGLAGILGSFIGGIMTLQRIEKESEVKLKEFASNQALELTKLELHLRKEEGRQKKFLAAAKIYREFYKALFELYETKSWPKAIETHGLLNIYDFLKRDNKNNDS